MCGVAQGGQAKESWKETGAYGKKSADQAREDLAERLSEEGEKAKQGTASVLENLQQTFNKVLGRTEEKASDAHDTLKVQFPRFPLEKWCSLFLKPLQ